MKSESDFHAHTQSEVEAFRDRHMALKRQKNALSPLYSLPSELLCGIFHFVQTDRDISARQSPLQWVRETTHISHALRTIALDDPSLWTNINIRPSSTSYKEFLKRSKEAPIHISSSFHKSTPAFYLDVRHVLEESLGRTETLHLDGARFPAVAGLFSHGSTVVVSAENGKASNMIAPCLRELTLSIAGGSSQGGFIFPDKAFAATKLAKLSLRGCMVDWEASALLQNLRHLSVEKIPGVTIENTRALRKALSNMPNLQSLTLSTSAQPLFFRGDFSDAPQQKQDTSHRRLESINLKSNTLRWIKLVLHGIAIRPSKALAIRLDNLYVEFHWEDIYDLFHESCHHTDESSIRTAYLRFGHRVGGTSPPGIAFIFDGWRTVPEQDREQRHPLRSQPDQLDVGVIPPIITIPDIQPVLKYSCDIMPTEVMDFSGSTRWESADRFLCGVFRSVDFARLEDLRLDFTMKAHPPPSTLADVFGRLSELRCVSRTLPAGGVRCVSAWIGIELGYCCGSVCAPVHGTANYRRSRHSVQPGEQSHHHSEPSQTIGVGKAH